MVSARLDRHDVLGYGLPSRCGCRTSQRPEVFTSGAVLLDLRYVGGIHGYEIVYRHVGRLLLCKLREAADDGRAARLAVREFSDVPFEAISPTAECGVEAESVLLGWLRQIHKFHPCCNHVQRFAAGCIK